MSARAHRAERSARGARDIRPVRRRGIVAASGFAVLVLALGGCGEEGTAEEAVGEATSAVGSVAAEATSAVGDATDRDGATTGEQPAPDAGDDGRSPEEQFLGEIRTVGVVADDEPDYLTRGRDACASLDGDMGYVDVVRQYNDAHPDAPVTEAPVVVAAAVRAFCPQHLPQVGQGG